MSSCTPPAVAPRSAVRRRLLVLALAGIALLFTGATMAPGAAHAAAPCDPFNDPNCPAPPPPPPPPTQPPCTGGVGPVHAWPCPAQSTYDCATDTLGPAECPPVRVIVAQQNVGGLTVGYDSGNVGGDLPERPSTAVRDYVCPYGEPYCWFPPDR